MNTRFLWKPENVVFNNRKEAIKTMGRSYYCQCLRNREFIFDYKG